jgi:hypothetical protein
VALLPLVVRANLASQSFIDHFNQYDEVYIQLVRLLAGAAAHTVSSIGNASLPPPQEFAETLLVDVVATALLSEDFVRFREALGDRLYIAPSEHNVWARSMARYALQEAITRGVFP